MRCVVMGIAIFLVAGAALAQEDASHVKEESSCTQAPLAREEVVDIARKALGDSFLRPPGMPERPYRVLSVGCVYYFEYVILSHGHEWFSFDGIDAVADIRITRDGHAYKYDELVYPKG